MNIKDSVKILDQMILNDDLDDEQCCNLLAIKKDFLFGNFGHSGKLKETQINVFYRYYIQNISLWLGIPIEEVERKTNNNDWNEIEHKFILTNILLLESKDKELANREQNYMDNVSM